MRGTQPRRRYLVGAGTLSGALLFVALTFASLPAGAQTSPAAPVAAAIECPVLSVANPGPGDQVPSGARVISGSAFDPASTSGSGISRVDVFLGARDQGGDFLGSAFPGASSDNPHAWIAEITLPDNVNAGVDFDVYAISAVTGQQTSVSFPIFVGNPTHPGAGPTPTPLPTTATISNTCRTGSLVVSQGPNPAAPNPPAATAAAVVAGTPAPAGGTGTGTANVGSCPILTLGNPNPGDTMASGGLVISGGAFVEGANPFPGVTRVDLFFGQRDEGGMFLGSAVPGSGAAGPTSWSVEVTVPNNLNRGSTFNAYAIAANGQETSISFPVFVGIPPTRSANSATPTPVPQTQVIATTCGHSVTTGG